MGAPPAMSATLKLRSNLLRDSIIFFWEFKLNANSNENKNATGEATYGGALRAPLAGSPARVFAFVFVLIYVSFKLLKKAHSPPPPPPTPPSPCSRA